MISSNDAINGTKKAEIKEKYEKYEKFVGRFSLFLLPKKRKTQVKENRGGRKR